MFKRKLILIVFNILLTLLFQNHLSYSQTTWEWINPTPTGNTLTKSLFITNFNGLIIGSCGTILRTTDGGHNWFKYPQFTQSNLLDVYFIDSLNGYLSATPDYLYKTTNGGENWAVVNQTYKYVYPKKIHFFDLLNGIAISRNGILYNTTDGGHNWILFNTGISADLLDIKFRNRYNGFIVGGNGTVLKTINGGLNWIYVPNTYGNDFDCLSYPNDSTIIFVQKTTTHILLKSTNSGLNLFTCYADNNSLNGTVFINSNTGYVGSQQRVLKTTNCGNNWTIINIPNLNTNIINSIFAKENNNIFATTYQSDIMTTFNGGLNWINVTKSVSSNHLTDIVFLDSLNGWIVGVNNILKTTNGGYNWITNFTSSKNLYRISFYGSNYGYCIDNSVASTSFFKTTNSGISWVLKNLANSTMDKNCVYALDQNTVFITTKDVSTTYNIYKSTNGGDNFQSVFASSTYITDITFLDTITGFAVHGQNLLKTTNRGSSWFYPISTFPVSHGRIKFINQNTGFLTGASVLKTTNGGSNWNEVIPYAYGISHNAISFANDSLGLIVGSNYFSAPESSFVSVTFNGGNNWVIENSITNNLIKATAFNKKTNAISVGNNGTIIMSGNGGVSVPSIPINILPYNNQQTSTLDPLFNWSYISNAQHYQLQISRNSSFTNILLDSNIVNNNFTIPMCFLYMGNSYYWRVRSSNISGTSYWSTPTVFYTYKPSGWYNQKINYTSNLNSILFLDSLNGFVCGDSGIVLRTNSGGDCWENIQISSKSNIKSLCFINSNTGWVCGDSGKILKTINGGINWINQESLVQNRLYKVFFCNQNIGWAIGDSSKLLKSANGGTNWQLISLPQNIYVNNFFTSDSNSIWLTCNDGNLLKSSNAGLNWQTNNIGISFNLNTIKFYGNIGLLGTSNNRIYKTINSGNNWDLSNYIYTSNINDIYLTDTNRYWLTGSGGYIYATNNGGVNWNYQCTGITNDLLGVCFSGIQKGWVVGKNGTVLHSETGNNVTSVNSPITALPNIFDIYNYPNPFNNITNFSFSIPNREFVTIRIYNVIGQLIKTIAESYYNPGNYIVQYNANNLSSGVYFYQLKSDKHSVTKKMLLLK